MNQRTRSNNSDDGMAVRGYDMDPNAAKEANSGGIRITDSGPYAGKIKQIWGEINTNGTESVQISFEADSGQQAGPLALYTFNGAGDELPSFKMLSAIMACCKVRSIKPKPGTVEVYDFDTSQVVVKPKPIYPELLGKRIGFVLQKEEYMPQSGKNAGTIQHRMIIHAAFEADTKLMASEILNRVTEAKALDRTLDYIENNPIKAMKKQEPRGSYGGAANRQEYGGGQNSGGYGNRGGGQQQAPVDDFADDDIPF